MASSEAPAQVSAAAEDAGLGAPVARFDLTGGRKTGRALVYLAISVLLLAVVVGSLSRNGTPGSWLEWGGLGLGGMVGLGTLYTGFEELVQAVRGRARVHLFEHGIVAVDARRRLQTFPWRTIRVEKDVVELKQTSYHRTPYYRNHVYTLIRPDGESLRLDSAMCEDVFELGPRIVAAVELGRGR